MDTNWETTYQTIAIIAALLNTLLLATVWQRTPSRLNRLLFFLALAQTVWALAYIGEIYSTRLDTMTFYAKIQYVGIVAVPVAWALLALQYSGNDHLITQRNIAAIAAIPITILVLVWTNEWHELHWAELYVDLPNDVPVLGVEPGPSYIVHTAYSYILMAAATILIIRTGFYSDLLQRRNAGILTVSWALVWITNILFVGGNSPLPGFDFTPLVFGIVAIVVVYFVTGTRLLDRLPISIETVIDNLPAGLIVIDATGLVVQINKSAATLLGLEQTDVQSKKIDDTLNNHPGVLEVYSILAKVENDEADEIERREEALLGKPGENGTTIEVTVQDLQTPGGRIVGHLVTIIDIGDYKKMQLTAARRYSELTALRFIDARMNSTLEVDHVLETALKSAIDMTSADAGFIALIEENSHRIVQTAGNTPRKVGERLPNDKGITGRVIKAGMPELVRDVPNDPDYLPSYTGVEAAIITPLVAHERPIGILHLEASKASNFTDDNYAFAQMLGGRIAVAIENAQLYSTSRQQLDELQKLYEHLSSLEQTKTDMIRIASHDLRNPLGTVIGYLDLFKMDEEQLSEDHRTYVDMMMERTEHMQRLVNDILSLERLEAASLTMRSIDLHGLVTRIVESCQRPLTEKNLKFEEDYDDNRVMVWADPVQIYEAMYNLIENAIKYTPEGGNIRVTLKRDVARMKAIFEVTDTGYGIPEPLQSRLFEPFYRADREVTRTVDGSGLGLHLVRNIVERHHGEVHFTSKVDEGSKFGFEIVLAPI